MSDKRSTRKNNPQFSSGQVAIDDLDGRLLGMCMSEGRASFRRMASMLGTSTTTVAAREARLRKGGVIKGYSARLDSEKLGYGITVVTEILVSKGKLLEMEREIAKLPGVCAVYDVTGEIDGIVVAKFRDREELSAFTKGLLAMPFVDRANTHVVLTTVREDFRLPAHPA
jgi:DNA-binding Lrp family transcriptional regulator